MVFFVISGPGGVLGNEAETGGNIEAQHGPEHPPLRLFYGFAQGERISRGNSGCSWFETGRQPSLRGIFEQLCAPVTRIRR